MLLASECQFQVLFVSMGWCCTEVGAWTKLGYVCPLMSHDQLDFANLYCCKNENHICFYALLRRNMMVFGVVQIVELNETEDEMALGSMLLGDVSVQLLFIDCQPCLPTFSLS